MIYCKAELIQTDTRQGQTHKTKEKLVQARSHPQNTPDKGVLRCVWGLLKWTDQMAKASASRTVPGQTQEPFGKLRKAPGNLLMLANFYCDAQSTEVTAGLTNIKTGDYLDSNLDCAHAGVTLYQLSYTSRFMACKGCNQICILWFCKLRMQVACTCVPSPVWVTGYN